MYEYMDVFSTERQSVDYLLENFHQKQMTSSYNQNNLLEILRMFILFPIINSHRFWDLLNSKNIFLQYQMMIQCFA